MSFGFSIGDFIAVGELVMKIVDISRGSSSEYQELIRELERYITSRGRTMLSNTMTNPLLIIV